MTSFIQRLIQNTIFIRKWTSLHSHKFVADFWLLLTSFLLFITWNISLSYKAKINLVVLFRHKNPESQYMSHKKYGVHLGLSGPFNFMCLQYSSSVRKPHSPSARACSPTTRTTFRAQSVHFAHTRIKKHALNQALYTSYKKNCVRFMSEKVILSSCSLFTLASLGRNRPHEDKITFSHLYRKSLF